MITVVNYEMGNLGSIVNAFTFLGVKTRITSDPREVAAAGKLLIPGVGAFNAGMANLNRLGLTVAIREAVQAGGVPVLGICLGMQLLAESSTEDGFTEGFGMVRAKVDRFSGHAGYRLPHIGFNQVEFAGTRQSLFKGIGQGRDFYFVHGFRMEATGADFENGITSYGDVFVASIEHENVFGVQFHPEKSQSNGLRLLENFARI
jgi:glutamine amidotransferase